MANQGPVSGENCDGPQYANDPGAHILCLLRSPFTAQIQANSIGVAFAYSLGITAATLVFFSLIRPRHHIVYEPKVKYADKKHCPPPLSKGIFSWIKPTLTMKEDVLIEKVGLDGAIFLRFTRMLRNMFLVLSVLGCCILIPIHVTQTPTGNQSFANKNPIALWVQQMTPQAVPVPVMWAHVAMGYIFNIVVLAFIWWNYRAVARIRKNYFLSKEYQASLHARSLWLLDLPSSVRSDQGILQVVDTIEHTAGIPRAAVARNVRELPQLIEEHDKTVKKLESVLAKYLKNPDKLPPERPLLRASKNDHRANRTDKIDAIDYLTRRIKDLEVEIKDTRESIDKRDPMAYGFAAYDRIEEAHTVALAASRKRVKGGVSVKLAPRPNDFIWKNLSLSKSARSRKKLVVNFWVALLTLIWVVPNAFIAVFLVNLSNLGAVVPSVQQSIQNNGPLYSVIQAILGPTLLSTFYLCLPIIFRRLSARAGDMTKTSRERHVTHKLYAFFIFNNLVVFSLFGSIFTFVANVVQSAGQQHEDAWKAINQANFTNSLLTALCQVSVFWITWLLQRNLTAAIDISQIVQLFWVWFSKTFLAPTPRQKITWTAPQPFDYAQYFNWFLFYATVALCNSMLQPIVLVCALIIFAISAVLYKYLLMYVYITKTESGGLYWNLLINRLLFGLGVSHVVGALVIKGVQTNDSDPWTTYIQLMCMAPLLFIILGFKYYTLKTFTPQCKYYVKALKSSAEAPYPEANKKRRNERLQVKFGHPALHKPLITPMVASKAQHVLPSLLRGQQFDDGSSYADGLAMDPMAPNQPGMRGGPPGMDPNMFEMVSEANMDFAYYKNRVEFGEEHGGGGELYGHANDLISERSGTPASFLTQDSEDARSATGTPPPMPTHPFHNQPEDMPNHPAFRNGGRAQSPAGLYTYRNDSQSRLLSNTRGYTAVSYEGASDGYGFPSGSALPTPTHDHSGMYGLDRWQTSGSGYGAYSAQQPEDMMGYDSYRTSAGAAHARNTSGTSHHSRPRTRSPGPNQAYSPYGNRGASPGPNQAFSPYGSRGPSPGPQQAYNTPQQPQGYNPHGQGYAANGGRF